MCEREFQIRESKPKDFSDIIAVETAAFGSDEEANLATDLLKDSSAEPTVSLLAFDKEKAIGHILFTRAYIGDKTNHALAYILAPLAVIPEYQKQGVGGLLIKTGLQILKEKGVEIVFVLGHISYYPNHGFITDAKSLGFPAPFPIPKKHADAWMLQFLTTNSKLINQGKIICADEMNKIEYWRE